MTDRARSEYVIRIEHLTRIYGPNNRKPRGSWKRACRKTRVFKQTGATVALWDVSLKIRRGEVFVIIGPFRIRKIHDRTDAESVKPAVVGNGLL